MLCGRSGPLGHFCSNQCVMNEVSVNALFDEALNRQERRSSEYQEDPDLELKQGDMSRNRIMLTPRNERMIDV